MLSLSQCRERAGLGSHEVVLGVTPCARHDQLLASYMLNIKKGERFVLEMIVADLRGFVDLGALDYAADVFAVLRVFLERRPHLDLAAHGRRDRAPHLPGLNFGAGRSRLDRRAHQMFEREGDVCADRTKAN